MTQELIEILLRLAIVSPLLLLFLKDRKKTTLSILFIFIGFVTINHLVLNLPLEFRNLRIFASNWNWSGKLYSILFSIVFLLVYKRFSLRDYFLRLKQSNLFFKYAIVLFLLVTASIAFYKIFYLGSNWRTETIAYQFTMPGIEEELAFRGIMLGLLTQSLKSKIMAFGFNIANPAILVTALLFGLAHGFHISNSYQIIFNFTPFAVTTLAGIAWAWITIKSGSILFPMISHNIGNTLGNL